VIKPFVTFAMFLMLILMSVSLHYVLFPSIEHSRKMQQVALLTNYVHLSLSEDYDATPYNSTYPEMPPLGRMDFVYEQ